MTAVFDELMGHVFELGNVSPMRRLLIVCGALAVMLAAGAIDSATRNSADWSVLYAVCVGIIAWYGGLWPGLAAAALAALISMATAIVGGGATAAGELLSALPIGFMLGLFAATLAFLHGVIRRTNELARTDPLTGLANSRAFREAVETDLVRARRYGYAISLAYLDVDDFKLVNDRQGHERGDELLVTLSGALSGQTRATDLVSRIGGDEFVILMPYTDEEGARTVLAKVRRGWAGALRSGGFDTDVSAGVVAFLTPPADVDAMIGLADETMYAAKRSGKARTEFATFQEASPVAAIRAVDAEARVAAAR